ncbi:ABATE domain-containing protein [Dyella sp. LX-66]|uniref:CGNR zinc finger domain-containing protein n=1 Tax=unclassified Dyella TaxID=2634549 RepID=UPI001BE0CC72|nr:MULTISPECIES: ABATE domain-containing protein [unclassified Dyella]MBT2117147.1 ABATE domain-containing protein [Dyella sp. LX-1]MBT2139777.1 ABATE domain-containing protein [Dyella sp. LX-66]
MPIENSVPQPRPVAAVRLDGGRLCLDFVNTIHDRYAVPAEDYIADPERFIQWCLRAGAIRSGENIAAPAGAGLRAALMRKLRPLRDHLHVLLAARIDGVVPADEAVQGVDQWLHRAWANQVLGADGRMHWRSDACDVLLPLQRIALDALDLLSGPSVAQLRRCDNTTTCGWLFFDTSKNQRRRWCAMETCGTEFKMGRYRRS